MSSFELPQLEPHWAFHENLESISTGADPPFFTHIELQPQPTQYKRSLGSGFYARRGAYKFKNCREQLLLSEPQQAHPTHRVHLTISEFGAAPLLRLLPRVRLSRIREMHRAASVLRRSSLFHLMLGVLLRNLLELVGISLQRRKEGMSIAVIGGAGYIGSHVVRELQSQGQQVVAVDDLSTGISDRIRGTPLLRCDISDPSSPPALRRFFRSNSVSDVIHFAAKKQVAESVADPLTYYSQNVTGTLNVLRTCVSENVQDFIFSSSAAVYGAPPSSIVDESSPTIPINPYGETKLIGERLASYVSQSSPLRVTSLRYFNVVGTASPSLADIGLFNLVPIAIDKLLHGQEIDVFGTDYPTMDGSCIRDYVHVSDLAEAHVSALTASRHRPPGTSRSYNVGTGSGTSVLQILEVLSRVSKLDLRWRAAERRAGDPASLQADVSLIAEELAWRSRHTVEDAIRSAWEANNVHSVADPSM